METQSQPSPLPAAIRVSGWQPIVFVVAALVLALLCCGIGFLVGGAVGFDLGRAAAPSQPTPEWRIFPSPVVPTPEGWPPMLTPIPGERPYLGVRYIMRPRGAEIMEVIPGSPAEKAGLQVGDLVREVNGRRVSSAHPLAELLSSYRPGDRVTLTVERAGEELEIEVVLGRQPLP